MCRGRIEACLVWLACADGFGQGVVDFQDDTFGTVFAESLLIFALDERPESEAGGRLLC